MEQNALNKKLADIGLSEYEIKVYVAVVKKREQTATEISKESGIPRSKAYDVLYRLIDKGLVTQSEVGKKRFTALDPFVGINNMQTAFQNKTFDTLQSFKSLPELLRNIQDTSTIKRENTFNIEVHTDLKDIKREIDLALNSARVDIVSYFKSDLFETYSEQKSILKALVSSVKVKTIYESSYLADMSNFRYAMQNKSLGQEVRKLNQVPFYMHIIDNNVAVVVTSDKTGINSQNNLKGYIVRNKDVVILFRSLFEYLWNMSESIF